MSDYSHIAQLLAEGLDSTAQVRQHYVGTQPYCWAYRRNAGQGGDEVLAVGSGTDAVSAWRMLLGQLARDERRLSTGEVAVLLNVSEGRVRQLMARGGLVPVVTGAGSASSRFDATVVARYIRLPLRSER